MRICGPLGVLRVESSQGEKRHSEARQSKSRRRGKTYEDNMWKRTRVGLRLRVIGRQLQQA